MEIIVKGADFSENRIGVVQKHINTATFNGISSFASFTPFSLTLDGDYVELLLDVENTTIGKYLTLRELWDKPTIGITKNKLSIRLDDQTWAVNNNSISPADYMNIKLKIAYEGTNIKVYIDDTLSFTYDNSITQASLTFTGFGKYSNSTSSSSVYWEGTIKKIRSNKVNDGEWCGVDELDGWDATDVELL